MRALSKLQTNSPVLTVVAMLCTTFPGPIYLVTGSWCLLTTVTQFLTSWPLRQPPAAARSPPRDYSLHHCLRKALKSLFIMTLSPFSDEVKSPQIVIKSVINVFVFNYTVIVINVINIQYNIIIMHDFCQGTSMTCKSFSDYRWLMSCQPFFLPQYFSTERNWMHSPSVW